LFVYDPKYVRLRRILAIVILPCAGARNSLKTSRTYDLDRSQPSSYHKAVFTSKPKYFLLAYEQLLYGSQLFAPRILKTPLLNTELRKDQSCFKLSTETDISNNVKTFVHSVAATGKVFGVCGVCL